MYTCSICHSEFQSTKGYKNHYEVKHLDIRYKCDVCGKKFTDKRHKKEHIDTIHKGIRYDCELCGKTSMSKSNLNHHIQSAILTIVEFFYCPNAVCRNDYCW